MNVVPGRSQRLVYLLTYSRADLNEFCTRQSFATAVIYTWNTVTTSTVENFVVCKEKHKEVSDNNANEYHYHMAVKLNRKSRWLAVRNALETRYGIKVNVSGHANYYDAYQYCVKEDAEVFTSPNHPTMDTPPRTTAATNSRVRRATTNDANTRGRNKRKRMLTVYEVTQIIREKKIESQLELMALAARQEKDGKKDLAVFIANRGTRLVNEALSIASQLEGAEEALERRNKTRIDVLNSALSSDCVEGCGKKWLTAALDILQRNDISQENYASAMYRALKLGRGKYQNIFIHGPANTGKTFMLSPLKKVYRAFVNPATGGFAWVGAEDAEVILLNDFRWSSSVIAWPDFLQMLEGDTMHLPAPKCFVSKDILFDKDTPFFATSDAPLMLVRGGCVDRINTNMMCVRWNYFEFWRPIPQEQQIRLQPCGRCFADLIINNKLDI